MNFRETNIQSVAVIKYINIVDYFPANQRYAQRHHASGDTTILGTRDLMLITVSYEFEDAI